MTVRLHLGDPYRSCFVARVVDAGDDYIELDQTCFFGPDGTLRSDTGCIAGHRVLGLRRAATGTVRHVLADPPRVGFLEPLEVGALVDCVVDWRRRHDGMRLHTAQHLVEMAAGATNDLVSTALRRVDGDSATIELVFTTSTVDVRAIGEWFTTAVRDDLSCGVSSEAVPPFGRLWHLDGYGFRRCGGIHCRSTGELDRLRFEAALLGPTRVGVILQAEPGAHPSSTP